MWTRTPSPTSAIGDPLRATDADSADTLTYSLDTASDAFFDIDSATGQLRTEAELDHETRKSYPVSVSVSDGKDANGDADPSADSTITVTVLVSDVNEDPSFALANDTRTIEENKPAGEPLGAPFQATDGDGDTLTYSLSGRDAADFEIDAASGQLRTRAALDYEAQSTYRLDVTATDPSGRQQPHHGHRHRRERGGAGRTSRCRACSPELANAERPPDRSRHGL